MYGPKNGVTNKKQKPQRVERLDLRTGAGGKGKGCQLLKLKRKMRIDRIKT